MAFKKIITGNGTSNGNWPTPRKWKDWKKDDYVIGTKGVSEHKDKYKKPIYFVVVQESNFGAKKGEKLFMNCGGNFRNMMDVVEDGETIRVTYTGMNKMKTGEYAGEMTHAMTVEIAEPDGAESASEDTSVL